MNEVKKHISDLIIAAAIAGDTSIAFDDAMASLSYPEINLGDVSSNIALQLARELKKPPMEIANALVEKINNDNSISRVEVKSPGFINFYLTGNIYSEIARNALADWQTFFAPDRSINADRTMVIDYSNPNIGKPMGVHHLLSTIIGDAIKLMYRQDGWKVIADNFIGDMGTQFGKLIWAVKQWGDLEEIEKDPITNLQKLYVKFHIEADENDELDQAGRDEYRKLEAGDKQNRELWQKIITWSKAEIAPIYDNLEVEFDYMNGESFYEDKMEAIIEQGKKSAIFIEDNGALIYRMDNPELPPAIIQKSDGATLYLTRDLARIDYWQKTWHPDVMVNVVDSAQSLQFKQLFEVSDRLKLTDATQKHVDFGRMNFRDSSMSTRTGNILLMSHFIDQAKQKTRELVEAKSSHLLRNEQDDLADRLAIAALKYNILRQNRQTNIVFDWDNMLTLEGSSAPYVAYGLSRARSIQERAQGGVSKKVAKFDENEKELLRHILILPEVLVEAMDKFKPNVLLNHLYTITQKYSHFYNEKRILDAPNDELINSRLLLNNLYLEAVSSGFKSLGINLPTRM